MENNYNNIMQVKSDEGLQEYLDKRLKYTPEAVEAAISELKKRGRVFTDSELATIRLDVNQKKDHDIQQEEKQSSVWRNNWKKNIVEDKTAPLFYSERAIYAFSVAFGVITGAILLAINCAKTEAKKDLWQIIAF